MSGAQGAEPPGSRTATTYKSVKGGNNKTKLDSANHNSNNEDQGGIQVQMLQDKIPDSSGAGGPVFGAGDQDNKQDLGVTGTGA
ncbi:uncharacterized protein LOC124913750 [Impatiens glandulifera]|uniref:uncharacterized protein LOC124913750 n=1 Tax=Impatiens glandulifera TaxID=253017 RepID=UPI001FB17415|nr:uncharacterized protein LOC124913750 [Impatiens glandulifera]